MNTITLSVWIASTIGVVLLIGTQIYYNIRSRSPNGTIHQTKGQSSIIKGTLGTSPRPPSTGHGTHTIGKSISELNKD